MTSKEPFPRLDRWHTSMSITTYYIESRNRYGGVCSDVCILTLYTTKEPVRHGMIYNKSMTKLASISTAGLTPFGFAASYTIVNFITMYILEAFLSNRISLNVLSCTMVIIQTHTYEGVTGTGVYLNHGPCCTWTRACWITIARQ